VALVRFGSDPQPLETSAPVVQPTSTSGTSGAFGLAAQAWFNKGWTPIPVDNSRIPKVSGYHGKNREVVTQQLLNKWLVTYADSDLAVVIPDGVLCLDIDTHDDKDGHSEWVRTVSEFGAPGDSVIQSTRDPEVHGHHFYLFDLGEGQRIRKTMASTNYVDIKGPGGFISVSPTLHHSLGTPYKWYDANLMPLASDFVPEINHFHRLPDTWRGNVEKPTAVFQVKEHGALKRFTNRPGDKLNDILAWEEVLEDYFEFTGLSNDVGYMLRRVGSENLTGAVISYDTDKLLVFTTSYADFLPPVDEAGAYSKYQAWTRIELMHKQGMTEDEAFGPGSGKMVLNYLGVDQNGDALDLDIFESLLGIEILPVKFLWKGGLVAGALNLLAGAPGTGKSTFTYNLAAEVTKGLVKGDFYGQPGVVLVCSTEDSVSQVIVPKLRAAGADLGKVFSMKLGHQFEFPEDYERISNEVRKFGGQVRLIVLDPLVNRMEKTLNSHKDKDVRKALEPFNMLAEQFDLVVLGVVHNSKASDRDPLNSISGSTAFGGVARSVLSMSKADDYEETHERCVGVVKSNVGRDDLPAYRFKVEEHHLSSDHPDHLGEIVTTTKLLWVGKSEFTQPEEIKKRMNKEKQVTEVKKEGVMGNALEEMMDFLQENGPSTATEIDSNVKANPRTLNEMRRRARQSGELSYNTKTHIWSLPSQTFSHMLEFGGLLPDGTSVSGSQPQSLGDFFEIDDAGIAQVVKYVVQSENQEAKAYAETKGWI
jgi:KaiC/GvpD/RAD55 family RecA-like ATPase